MKKERRGILKKSCQGKKRKKSLPRPITEFSPHPRTEKKIGGRKETPEGEVTRRERKVLLLSYSLKPTLSLHDKIIEKRKNGKEGEDPKR